MKTNIESKVNCYSCHGCEKICPVNAISFGINDREFEIPRIDSNLCVECGKCINVCKKINDGSIPIKAYVFEVKNKKDLMSASSGGAFYELAKAFFESGGDYIYGVCYDENMKVCHCIASDIEQVKKFRKSKYIQSKMNCFSEIDNLLKKEKRVLFSGTPCQIDGLYKYLGGENENLFTIDLICTGVMSPRVFSKYLNLYQNVTGFDWRYKHVNKDKTWNVMDSSIEINGKRWNDKYSILLKRLYGRKYGFKESCYSCKYSSLVRVSDITLGDFWGEKSYFGEYMSRGMSAVIINTTKGELLFNRIRKESVRFDSISIDVLKNQNPALSNHSFRPEKNDLFWKDIENNIDIKKILKKYTKNSLKSSIKMGIAKVLPQKIVKYIQKGLIKNDVTK